MKKFCILGAAGFIGSHLSENLLAKTEAEIVGIDVHNTKIARLKHYPRFHFIQADLYSLPNLPELLASCDAVVMLSSLCNPALYNTKALEVIASNYDRPLQVVKECARQKKWLIHFSTCEVYGKTPAALSALGFLSDPALEEETSPMILGSIRRQRWTYACAKQLLERVIFAYGKEQGLPYTIVRPFNFIGPRMDFLPSLENNGVPRVFACFMDALLFGKPLNLVDGGKNRRVFTYIHDAVDAVMRILSLPNKSQGHIFNIGAPENETSIRELAKKMIALFPEACGKPIAKSCVMKNVSSADFYGADYDDSDRRVPDISLARKLLGWEPKTSLKETLVRSMRGYSDEIKDEHQ